MHTDFKTFDVSFFVIFVLLVANDFRLPLSDINLPSLTLPALMKSGYNSLVFLREPLRLGDSARDVFLIWYGLRVKPALGY